MRNISKIIAPALIAALTIGAASVPAQAAQHSNQVYGRQGHNDINRHVIGAPTAQKNSNIRAEINDLNRQIDRAQSRRSITKKEATKLKSDVSQVQRLYASYSRNGLTRNETQTLQNRVDRIKSQLNRNAQNYRR